MNLCRLLNFSDDADDVDHAQAATSLLEVLETGEIENRAKGDDGSWIHHLLNFGGVIKHDAVIVLYRGPLPVGYFDLAALHFVNGVLLQDGRKH